MLNIVTPRSGFLQKNISFVLLILLSSCSLCKADEETFSLFLNGKSYDTLVSTLQTYSLRRDYHVASEVLVGTSPENTSRHIMLDGNGVRFLIQSALAEQCEEREGRRDVEYSLKVFDVNALSTSYFRSSSDLSDQVEHLKGILIDSDFRVVSRSESCDLL
jgi:hypothetical protein